MALACIRCIVSHIYTHSPKQSSDTYFVSNTLTRGRFLFKACQQGSPALREIFYLSLLGALPWIREKNCQPLHFAQSPRTKSGFCLFDIPDSCIYFKKGFSSSILFVQAPLFAFSRHPDQRTCVSFPLVSSGSKFAPRVISYLVAFCLKTGVINSSLAHFVGWQRYLLNWQAEIQEILCTTCVYEILDLS